MLAPILWDAIQMAAQAWVKDNRKMMDMGNGHLLRVHNLYVQREYYQVLRSLNLVVDRGIGIVDKKELETLMTRGLDEEEAVDIIVQGMLEG